MCWEVPHLSHLSQISDHCFPSKTVKVLESHTDEVWYVAFSNNGRYLASVSKDQTCVVWNMSVRKLILICEPESCA